MKSELEKMLAGELYNAADPELTGMRRRARHLLARFNRSGADDMPLRESLLRRLFHRVGAKIEIEPPFYCDYGSNISLGENIFMNFNCVVLDVCHVTIGDNVQFAPSVQIYAATHPIPAADRIKGPELGAPVTIGHNCWLGGGVIVLPGVTIGDNTTIGAGSVVTRNIPANVVAAGNPCRILRELS